MSIYYLNAKNYYGNNMKVPIEAKHIYKNPSQLSVASNRQVNLYKGKTQQSTSEYSRWYGHKAEPYSANILYCSNHITASTTNPEHSTVEFPAGWDFTRGTSYNQVIGDKIMIKSIRLHFEIQQLVNTFFQATDDKNIFREATKEEQNLIYLDDNDDSNRSTDLFNNYAWRRDFRVQLIHFYENLPSDEDGLRAYLAKWYDSTYVPTTIHNGISAPNELVEYGYTIDLSNHVKMMRESTGYTGKFSIIKDFTFTMNNTKTYENFDIKIKPKKQVNLAWNTANGYLNITDDWFKNTVLVLWSPMDYNADMDPMSASVMRMDSGMNTPQAVPTLKWTYWAKMTYYDV